jgi:hypothetical protein
MNTALLLLTLLSADDAPAPAPEAEVVVAAPKSDVYPDEWPGEGTRRVRFGVGARGNFGAMYSQGAIALDLQSEFAFFVAIRVFGHHEWRVGVGIGAGLPDLAASVITTSFRWHLTPRLSVGAGVVTWWGLWSLRGGVEVPFALRLGSNRRYEVTLTLRGMAGVYNGSTFRWYDFQHQRFAISGDAIVGFAAIF